MKKFYSFFLSLMAMMLCAVSANAQSSEVVFKLGDLGNSYVANYTTPIEGEGVTVTPVSNVMVHVYEMGELYLAQGTLQFTSKTDKITSIEFVGMGEATVSKGTYADNKWTVELAKGESATIKSAFGAPVEKITVNYNGGSSDEGGAVEEKGFITVTWPTLNMPLEKIADGGILAEFTTTKFYSSVTVELRNTNATYHDLYDLPMRYMDQLQPGNHVCKTTTPGTSTTGGNPAWYAFKGDSYELVVKGYVNYWDIGNDANDRYEAIATVPVVGNGIEHEILSALRLVNITPATQTEIDMETSPAKLTNTRDNIVKFEYSGPVAAMTASVPAGAAGGSGLKLACTRANANGTLWQVTVPQSDLTDPSYFFDITAMDTEGHYLDLNPKHADHTLGLFFEVVSTEVDETVQASLGTPAFSIADGQENVPVTTESILMTFPQAKGYAAGVKAIVNATLYCRDQSEPVSIEARGTVAEGVVLPVTLAADKGYALSVSSILLTETVTQEIEGSTMTFDNPIATYNTNYGIAFYTGKNNTGGSDAAIKLVVTKVEEGALFVKIDGIKDLVPEVTSDHMYNFASQALVNGEIQSYSPGMNFGSEIYSEAIRLTDYNVIEEGKTYTIVVPAGTFSISVWPLTDPDPTDLYTNAEDIVITYPEGEVDDPSDDPSDDVQSVVLYEYPLDQTTLDEANKSRTISKNGVTLVAKGSNAYTIPAEGGNFNGLRVGRYVTLTFTSEKEIESIEFTTTGTVWSGVTDLTAGSFNGAVWSCGNADVNEVSFKTSGDQTISKIVVNFKQTSTSINTVKPVVDSNAMYNLQGQRVYNAKGIVIIGGKKVVVK